MGDTFDNRTGINYSALGLAKDNYFDILRDRGIDLKCGGGNHTAYYKNTNKVNACELLLREYDNIHVVTEYEELNIGGLDIATSMAQHQCLQDTKILCIFLVMAMQT